MPSKTKLSPFARRLRFLRERAGISGSEVARRAGITQHFYSRLETGKAVPSWTTVQEIARALQATPNEFQ